MDIRLDFIKLRLVPMIESVSYILRKMFNYKFKKKKIHTFRSWPSDSKKDGAFINGLTLFFGSLPKKMAFCNTGCNKSKYFFWLSIQISNQFYFKDNGRF